MYGLGLTHTTLILSTCPHRTEHLGRNIYEHGIGPTNEIKFQQPIIENIRPYDGMQLVLLMLTYRDTTVFLEHTSELSQSRKKT